MKYKFPKQFNLSKKDSEQINSIVESAFKSFLYGLFFFVTIPIQIYARIKVWRKRR